MEFIVLVYNNLLRTNGNLNVNALNILKKYGILKF